MPTYKKVSPIGGAFLFCLFSIWAEDSCFLPPVHEPGCLAKCHVAAAADDFYSFAADFFSFLSEAVVMISADDSESVIGLFPVSIM